MRDNMWLSGGRRQNKIKDQKEKDKLLQGGAKEDS
jgi:hypothetical protein